MELMDFIMQTTQLTVKDYLDLGASGFFMFLVLPALIWMTMSAYKDWKKSSAEREERQLATQDALFTRIETNHKDNTTMLIDVIKQTSKDQSETNKAIDNVADGLKDITRVVSLLDQHITGERPTKGQT